MYVELGVFIGVLVSSLVAAILITAAVTWTIFKKRHPPPPPPPPQKYREPTSQTYEPSPDVGVFQNPYFERNVGHRNNETVLNLDTISRDSSSFEQCSTTYENGFATYDLAEDVEIPDGQSGNQVHHERDNSSGFSPENKTNVYDLTETSSQSSNKVSISCGNCHKNWLRTRRRFLFSTNITLTLHSVLHCDLQSNAIKRFSISRRPETMVL